VKPRGGFPLKGTRTRLYKRVSASGHLGRGIGHGEGLRRSPSISGPQIINDERGQNMTDDTKVREISKRLDEITPYPEHGTVTAAGLAKYLATWAQVAYVTGLNPAADLPGRQAVLRMAAEFAAAHALYALADLNEGRANVVAAQIFDAWEDGGGIGEWLWEHLRGDAEVIGRLAEELASAQAVTADA